MGIDYKVYRSGKVEDRTGKACFIDLFSDKKRAKINRIDYSVNPGSGFDNEKLKKFASLLKKMGFDGELNLKGEKAVFVVEPKKTRFEQPPAGWVISCLMAMSYAQEFPNTALKFMELVDTHKKENLWELFYIAHCISPPSNYNHSILTKAAYFQPWEKCVKDLEKDKDQEWKSEARAQINKYFMGPQRDYKEQTKINALRTPKTKEELKELKTKVGV